MNAKKNLIQASSLAYAVSFLLLIGLISSAVLFISSTNLRIKVSHENTEHMLFNNYWSLKHCAHLNEDLPPELIHDSGDTTKITTISWASYRIINAKTYRSKKTIIKSAIIGPVRDAQIPVLYLPDFGRPVKLCGLTRIEGDAYISRRGFEKGYINGIQYHNNKLIYGKQYLSKDALPKLNPSVKNSSYLKLCEHSKKLKNLPSDSTFSFSNETSLFESLNHVRINQTFRGNLIIKARDSIIIEPSALLSNVILIAPFIRVKNGFNGNLQAIATKAIICEENTSLNYPSALILDPKSKIDEQPFIELKKDSKIIGGVLLLSNDLSVNGPKLLVDQALIGGLVYNQGESEIKGEIIGSLYTEELNLNYGSGSYRGHLLNANLSSNKLPLEFVMPNWLTKRVMPNKIVSCF